MPSLSRESEQARRCLISERNPGWIGWGGGSRAPSDPNSHWNELCHQVGMIPADTKVCAEPIGAAMLEKAVFPGGEGPGELVTMLPEAVGVTKIWVICAGASTPGVEFPPC